MSEAVLAASSDGLEGHPAAGQLSYSAQVRNAGVMLLKFLPLVLLSKAADLLHLVTVT